MKKELLTPVFVYGSLLSGLYNHHHLKGSKFLRADRTVDLYSMLDLGNYPGVAYRTGEGVKIIAELYEVDNATLARFDRLEGHPHHFKRSVVSLEGGEAWMYFIQRTRMCDYWKEVAGGDWRSYFVTV